MVSTSLSITYNDVAQCLVRVGEAIGSSAYHRSCFVQRLASAAVSECFVLPADEVFFSAFISARSPYGYFVRWREIMPGAFNPIAITRFDLLTGELLDVIRHDTQSVPWPIEVLGELADGSGIVVKACVEMRPLRDSNAARAVYAAAVVPFAAPGYRTLCELDGAFG